MKILIKFVFIMVLFSKLLYSKEKIELVTYYPAPFGDYENVSTNTTEIYGVLSNPNPNQSQHSVAAANFNNDFKPLNINRGLRVFGKGVGDFQDSTETNPRSGDVSGFDYIELEPLLGDNIQAVIFNADGSRMHGVIVDTDSNKLELREYGNIVFSSGAIAGNATDKVVIDSDGDMGIGVITPGDDFAWSEPALDISGVRGTLSLSTTDVGGISTIRFKGPSINSKMYLNFTDSVTNPSISLYSEAKLVPGNLFYIDGRTGYVAIGDIMPTSKLDVDGNINSSLDIVSGRDILSNGVIASVGDITSNGNIKSSTAFMGIGGHGASYAHFSHSNKSTANNYAVLQDLNGTTRVNSASGKNLYFNIANNTKMELKSHGGLYIGSCAAGNAGPSDTGSYPYDGQLLLGGAYDSGANDRGYKLVIYGYDNDNDYATSPIICADEDNGIDFYIMGKTPSQGNKSTAYFGGNVMMPQIYARSGYGGNEMRVESNGLVAKRTSSIRYKKNIRKFNNYENIYKVPVVVYDAKDVKNKDKQTNIIGIIAESLKPIFPKFILYDLKGLVESYSDSAFIPVLIKTVQEQKKEIDEMQKNIEQLKVMFKKLEKDIIKKR